MRTFSIGAFLALSLAAAPAVHAQSWTGPYLGVSIGTADSNDIWKDTGSPDFNAVGHGGIYGLQGGYNWQIGRQFVVGIEGDYLSSGMKGQVLCPDPTQTCAHSVKDLSSIRARLGWLGTPFAMIYLTGGAGHGTVERSVSDAVTGSQALGGTVSHSSTGVVLGSGLEYLFYKNLSIKAEYLHYDLGAFTNSAPIFEGVAPNFKAYADTFKLGLNARF